MPTTSASRLASAPFTVIVVREPDGSITTSASLARMVTSRPSLPTTSSSVVSLTVLASSVIAATMIDTVSGVWFRPALTSSVTAAPSAGSIGRPAASASASSSGSVSAAM